MSSCDRSIVRRFRILQKLHHIGLPCNKKFSTVLNCTSWLNRYVFVISLSYDLQAFIFPPFSCNLCLKSGLSMPISMLPAVSLCVLEPDYCTDLSKSIFFSWCFHLMQLEILYTIIPTIAGFLGTRSSQSWWAGCWRNLSTSCCTFTATSSPSLYHSAYVMKRCSILSNVTYVYQQRCMQ